MKLAHLLLALGLLLLVSEGSKAWGQIPKRYPGGRYSSPSGPTITPYLNYFRRDTGVLDQYNTFIRPRQMLSNELGRMNYLSAQQANQFNQELANARSSMAAPTGTGAGFMNLSHYYGGGAGGGGGGSRPARVPSFGGY